MAPPHPTGPRASPAAACQPPPFRERKYRVYTAHGRARLLALHERRVDGPKAPWGSVSSAAAAARRFRRGGSSSRAARAGAAASSRKGGRARRQAEARALEGMRGLRRGLEPALGRFAQANTRQSIQPQCRSALRRWRGARPQHGRPGPVPIRIAQGTPFFAHSPSELRSSDAAPGHLACRAGSPGRRRRVRRRRGAGRALGAARPAGRRALRRQRFPEPAPVLGVWDARRPARGPARLGPVRSGGPGLRRQWGPRRGPRRAGAGGGPPRPPAPPRAARRLQRHRRRPQPRWGVGGKVGGAARRGQIVIWSWG